MTDDACLLGRMINSTVPYVTEHNGKSLQRKM